MKNLQFVFLITTMLLNFSTFTAKGQTIGKFDGNKWTYESKVYKYSEMGSIFEQNSKAKTHYNMALQKKKASKAWAYTAGVSACTGLIFLAINKDCTGSFDCLDNAIYESVIPVITLALVIPSVIIASAQSGKANKHKQMSVDIFNNEISINMYPKEPLKLNIIVSNGLGLQLKF